MVTFVGIAVISSVSLFFLSEEPPIKPSTENSKSFLKQVFSAVILCKDKRIILLIPIMFYSGFEESFIFGTLIWSWLLLPLAPIQLGG